MGNCFPWLQHERVVFNSVTGILGHTGPHGKKSNRYGQQVQYGVYCHKHATRKKAANYMKHFQYQGFIAASLLQLKVRRDYIACGDQWCCDPAGVQIESVWIHVVPIRSVDRGSLLYIYLAVAEFLRVVPSVRTKGAKICAAIQTRALIHGKHVNAGR